MRWGASRAKATYLKPQFQRLRGRRSAKKAVCAASIFTTASHMLRTDTAYHDLGSEHFERRTRGDQSRRLVVKLRDLGYNLEISPIQPDLSVVSC